MIEKIQVPNNVAKGDSGNDHTVSMSKATLFF